MGQFFFDYVKKKRNLLLSGRRLSKKSRFMIDTIEMIEKGQGVDVPVGDESEAHNIRAWIANNRKHLKPEVRDIKTSYKKEKNILHIYRE